LTVADHPVKVPPELVASLRNSAPHGIRDAGVTRELGLINSAYAAGADQELEACCEWLRSKDILEPAIDALRVARRPKPPSLAEQGCDALDAYIYGNPDHGDKQNTYNTIRTALNRLAELEAQQ
jgi:hypothetical protein